MSAAKPKNLYFSTLHKIYHVLAPADRTKAMLIFFSTFINGLLDVMGIAMIIPVIYLINDSPKIHANTFLQATYQNLGFKSDQTFIFFLICSLAVVFVLKNLLGLYFVFIQERYINVIGQKITIREFKKYLNSSYSQITSISSSQIQQEVARVPVEFARNIITPILYITTEYFVVFLIILGILIYDYRIVLLLLMTIFPITYVLNRLTKQKIKVYGDIRNQVQFKTYKDIIEAIYAYIDIRLTNNKDYFIQKTNGILTGYFHTMTRLLVLQNVPVRLIETSAVLGIAILYFFATFLLKQPETVVTILVLFATASYRLLPSLNRILTSMMQISSFSYVFDSISDYSDDSDENLSKENIAFNNSIELKNISYRYPDKELYALQNINLTVKAGDTIGLIGQSGSGKTTLGKLILRLITENEGQFLIDGIPLKNQSIYGWNHLLGYVRQDFYLLDGTLAENIAFGIDNDSIDIEKINRVINQVQLREVVDQLPHGIYANIGEFGGKLSGGQRQRIAIARALYKEAKILVFDEATSALDNETEKEIMQTLYSLQSHKLTIIIIAHRLSTLEKCDHIYEMKDGIIINRFSYNELKGRI